MKTKTITIRIPEGLWRKLKIMQAYGEIKSINSAIRDWVEKIIPEHDQEG